MQRCEAHIVYCENRMLLDKGPYADWRAIQDVYADYTASLGPWSEDEILEFLRDDWGTDESKWPFSRESIAAFFCSSDRVLRESVA
jgi:hypothetical protein